MTELTAPAWEQFLETYPDAHVLQSAAWGELKSEFGWQPVRVATGGAGAQLLFKRLPFGLSLAYLPKGPVGDDWPALWPEIDAACRKRRAVFLKVEPDCWESPDLPANPIPQGFVPGQHAIQPQRTLLVDLQGDEEQVLGRMKQKTRYNIRLAQKKGIVVRELCELDLFHRLMRETGERDRFGVHSLEYYRRAYELFYRRSECELLLAEFEGQPLAALMVFARGRRAWYFYGASTSQQRERMPTYLLQWEAMRWARQRGCLEYDLWGVPDESEAVLEEHFAERGDGLWGVYRFKRGFGGLLRRAAGPWDRVYYPGLYHVYRAWAARRGTR